MISKSIVYKIVVSVMMMGLLYSCNLNTMYTNDESDKEDAEKIVTELYNYIEKSNYAEAQKLFSEKFFSVTPADTLNTMFVKIKSLGKYKGRNLRDWKTLRVEGSKPKAEYVLLYDVSYELYNSQETITMQMEGDNILIIGYQVYSDGFQ